MKRFFILYTYETYQGVHGQSTRTMVLEKLVPRDVAAIIAEEQGFKRVTVTRFRELDEQPLAMPADSARDPVIEKKQPEPVIETKQEAPAKQSGRKRKAQ